MSDACWAVLEGDSIMTPLRLSSPKLILTDPPFGTGKRQAQRGVSYLDPVANNVSQILSRWGSQLDPDGTMAVMCDYRSAPMVMATLDFLTYRGEIIWTFGLGRPRQSWWPNRHNNILTFTHTPTSGLFDKTAVPREVRKAPVAGYPDDKPAGSVWDYTMNNTSTERVGYPNQKPLAILEPFVLAHTLPGDLVVDPFCGSGSTGVAAVSNGRHFLGVDNNTNAVTIARKRLSDLTIGRENE